MGRGVFKDLREIRAEEETHEKVRHAPDGGLRLRLVRR